MVVAIQLPVNAHVVLVLLVVIVHGVKLDLHLSTVYVHVSDGETFLVGYLCLFQHAIKDAQKNS